MSQDTRYIDIHAQGEIAYWIKVLNTTHEELLAAIAAVGPQASAVSAYLKRGSSSEPPPAGQVPDGG
jgi:hypothetical protein